MIIMPAKHTHVYIPDRNSMAVTFDLPSAHVIAVRLKYCSLATNVSIEVRFA